jgi:hypothetical protein
MDFALRQAIDDGDELADCLDKHGIDGALGMGLDGLI